MSFVLKVLKDQFSRPFPVPVLAFRAQVTENNTVYFHVKTWKAGYMILLVTQKYHGSTIAIC